MNTRMPNRMPGLPQNSQRKISTAKLMEGLIRAVQGTTKPAARQAPPRKAVKRAYSSRASRHGPPNHPIDPLNAHPPSKIVFRFAPSLVAPDDCRVSCWRGVGCRLHQCRRERTAAGFFDDYSQVRGDSERDTWAVCKYVRRIAFGLRFGHRQTVPIALLSSRAL